MRFECLSAGGCDYAPGMTLSDHAVGDTGFDQGTNTVYLNGGTTIGTCQVTASDIDCDVTVSGHANQGDTITTAGIGYWVNDGVPPQTKVFERTLTLPAGWVGDDASNNTFPVYTPAIADAPMISWQIGTGAGALLLLLAGGAGVLVYRRRKTGAVSLGAGSTDATV